MNYLQNHIWCSDSNWGGEYNCRHTVFLGSYSKGPDKEDWDATIDENADRYVDEVRFNAMIERLIERGRDVDPDDIKENYEQPVPNLKPEVLQWLNDNVKDKPKAESDGHLKGWCVGSVAYRSTNPSSFNIYFYRRRDAMAFIKRWSKWKKPVHYCQYFSDVRKKLNLETLKYEPH